MGKIDLIFNSMKKQLDNVNEIVTDNEKIMFMSLYSFFQQNYNDYLLDDIDTYRSLGSLYEKYYDDIFNKHDAKKIIKEYKKIYSNMCGLFIDKINEITVYENMIESKELYSLEEVINDVSSFYKTFDKDSFKYIKKNIITPKNIITLKFENIEDSYINLNGEVLFYKNNPLIYIELGYNKTKDMYKNYVKSCLAHEFGHYISYINSSSNDIMFSPLAEALAINNQMIFDDSILNKEEGASNFFNNILLLKNYNDDLKEKKKYDEITRGKFYQYIFGNCIGMYLSNLYKTNKEKFYYYYNETKKYTGINDNKIIELFLQDSDFIKMEHVDRELDSKTRIFK